MPAPLLKNGATIRRVLDSEDRAAWVDMVTVLHLQHAHDPSTCPPPPSHAQHLHCVCFIAALVPAKRRAPARAAGPFSGAAGLSPARRATSGIAALVFATSPPQHSSRSLQAPPESPPQKHAGQPPQPAGSQDQQDGKLILPQLNRLHEAIPYKRNQVASSASASPQDQQPATPTILSQKRGTQQLTTHWPLFKALRQTFANTRFVQQL